MVFKLIEIIYEQVEGISILIMLLSIIIGFIMVNLINFIVFKINGKKISITKTVLYCLIIVSWSFMLQITILNRVGESREIIRLIPFSNIFTETGELSEKNFLYAFFNVFLFVPYGFFWASIKSQLDSMRRYFIVIAISFLTSLAIEIFQLVTKWGYFETEDLICNSIGGLIGCFVFGIVVVAYSWITKNRNGDKE